MEFDSLGDGQLQQPQQRVRQQARPATVPHSQHAQQQQQMEARNPLAGASSQRSSASPSSEVEHRGGGGDVGNSGDWGMGGPTQSQSISWGLGSSISSTGSSRIKPDAGFISPGKSQQPQPIRGLASERASTDSDLDSSLPPLHGISVDRPDLVESLLRRLVSLPLSPCVGSARDAEKLEGIIENIEELVTYFFSALELSLKADSNASDEMMAAMTFSLLDESFSVFKMLPPKSLFCCGECDDTLLELLQRLAVSWSTRDVYVNEATLSIRSVIMYECSLVVNHLSSQYLEGCDIGEASRSGESGTTLRDTNPMGGTGKASNAAGGGASSIGRVTVSIRFPKSMRWGRNFSTHQGASQTLLSAFTILVVVALGVMSCFLAFFQSDASTSSAESGAVNAVRVLLVVLSVLAIGATICTQKLLRFLSGAMLRSFEVVERNSALAIYAPPSSQATIAQQDQQDQQPPVERDPYEASIEVPVPPAELVGQTPIPVLQAAISGSFASSVNSSSSRGGPSLHVTPPGGGGGEVRSGSSNTLLPQKQDSSSDSLPSLQNNLITAPAEQEPQESLMDLIIGGMLESSTTEAPDTTPLTPPATALQQSSPPAAGALRILTNSRRDLTNSNQISNPSTTAASASWSYNAGGSANTMVPLNSSVSSQSSSHVKQKGILKAQRPSASMMIPTHPPTNDAFESEDGTRIDPVAAARELPQTPPAPVTAKKKNPGKVKTASAPGSNQQMLLAAGAYSESDAEGKGNKMLLPLEKVNGSFLLASTRAACEYIIAVGYDKKGKILVWNTAASSASGHDDANVVGKNIDTFLDIDEPHSCRRIVHCTMYTKTGTHNLRGTISSLYSEGNPKKIGHVFLAPNRSSESLRFVHSYRREQVNELVCRLKDSQGDVYETQSVIPVLEKISRLMEWSSVIDLSESIEREWSPVTRNQLLTQLKGISQFIEVTETVPERFTIDMELLTRVLAEIAGTRRAKIKVEGVEFGTEFMSLNFCLTTSGGGYPFLPDDIEDHLGVELAKLGCHITAGEDQSEVTMQVPTVVNLHLQSPGDDLSGDKQNPIVVTVWGATDDTMIRNFSSTTMNLLLEEERERGSGGGGGGTPSITLRALHMNDLLINAIKCSHAMVTTPQAVDVLRSVLQELQNDADAKNNGFEAPLVCVVTSAGGGADAALSNFQVREGELRIAYPFEEDDVKRWFSSVKVKWKAARASKDPLWVQGPLLGRGAVGTVYEAILGTTDFETGSVSFPGGGGMKAPPAPAEGQSLAIKHVQKEKRNIKAANNIINRRSSPAASYSNSSGSGGAGTSRGSASCESQNHTMLLGQWKEVEILRSLNHPNIIALHFVEENSDRFSMALELCIGSICEVAHSRSPVENANIMRQVVEGVAYIHSMNVVHRDLKTGNVLLTPDNVVKLTDFGVAEVSDNVDSALKEMAGTYRFMAPEVFQGAVATSASDIWSIGCILCELLGALPLFMKKRQHMRLATLTTVEIPRKIVDPLTRDFLASCFQLLPENRPTAEKLLKSPYLLAGASATASSTTAAGGAAPSSLFHSPVEPGCLRPRVMCRERSDSVTNSVASCATAFTMDSTRSSEREEYE